MALFEGVALGGALSQADRGAGDAGGEARACRGNGADLAQERGGQVPAKEFVLETHEGLNAARIALAGAATEELAVDAAGFVPFRGEDIETPF